MKSIFATRTQAKRLVDSYYKKKTAVEKGIQEKPIYLERFFRNLLLNEHNELKNRFTHIDYDELALTKMAIGKC